MRLYTDHETNIFACVRQTLQKDEFPNPPFSPYYMHVSMSFSRGHSSHTPRSTLESNPPPHASDIF